MRRTRITAATVMVAAGLIGAAAGPASAVPPTLRPAEALCAAQGGEFSFSGGTARLFCTATSTFSEAQVGAARAICQNAYRGLFLPPEAGPTEFEYSCILGAR